MVDRIRRSEGKRKWISIDHCTHFEVRREREREREECLSKTGKEEGWGKKSKEGNRIGCDEFWE